MCEFTDEAGLDMRKMGGIRTDGAATMAGCHNGCMSQKNYKRLTSLHHKLEMLFQKIQ